MEQIFGYIVIALVAAICVFMVVHTIIELKKLNKKTIILDVIESEESIGKITLDKDKLTHNILFEADDCFYQDDDLVYIKLLIEVKEDAGMLPTFKEEK